MNRKTKNQSTKNTIHHFASAMKKIMKGAVRKGRVSQD